MKTIFVYFLRYIVFPILSLFVDRIEGKENIPPDNNFIITPNHLSGRDHFFIGYTFKERIKDLRFVGALDTLRICIQSSFLYYLSNTIAINRKEESRESVLKKIKKNLKKDKIIVIYPEGDSNPKPYLLKGKSGIAELALSEKVPVLPIGLQVKNKGRVIKIGKLMKFPKKVKEFQKLKSKGEKYYLLLREVTDKIMRRISKLCQKPYSYEKNK